MKFIKFRNGRGVYHLSLTKGSEHPRALKWSWAMSRDEDVTLCDGNFAINANSVTDHPPSGKLCARCKKIYVREHSEEELFAEIL